MRTLAKIFLGLVLLGGVASATTALLPHDPKADAATFAAETKLVADQRRDTWRDGNINLAERQIRVVLKDPDSATFRNVAVVAPSEKQLAGNETGIVCGEVNARNSFNGYVGYKDFVVIRGIPGIEDGRRAFVNLWNKFCANRPLI